MKNLLPIIALAILFAGCEKIEGQLNVTTDVRLNTTKGVARNVRVGTYSADIKANTSKKITLRLNNDNDESYSFNIPDGSIPSNGTFSYKSNVVGQPVDLTGTVATNVTQSEKQTVNQSCQYQVPVQNCYPIPGGGVNCSVHYETRFGYQWTQYYTRKTVKDVNLSIAASGSTTESAQFQGGLTTVERITVGQGPCR